jgi:hypothetical protein
VDPRDDGPMGKSTADQLDAAMLDGAAGRVRAVLRVHADADLELRHRAEWPALWDAIDALVAIQDKRDQRERRPLF